MSTDVLADHDRLAAAAASALRDADQRPIALRKSTSNLFRDRARGDRRWLDLSALDRVLDADPGGAWVEAEGLATYEDVVDWTLARGFMPAVVPQLQTITVGGAIAGVGVEATSFRHGLVHDTMLELEVLLPGGEIVRCSPDNEHADLFFGFPNSYGTLGYALSVRLAGQPVRPFVHVTHRPYLAPAAFFDALGKACAGDSDFVEGVVFGAGELVLSTARFTGEAAQCSDYHGEACYWQSVRNGTEDDLTVRDWLWRWDTDWFWCSRRFGADRPWVRRMLGPGRLNSRTYTRWMRQAARYRLPDHWSAMRGRYRESVIQDVDIPLSRAPQFLDFLLREIGILPVWACPVRAAQPGRMFPLYPLRCDEPYVNFGFWDTIETAEPHPPGHFTRKVELETARLGGLKSLYSDCYLAPEDFDEAYDMAVYARLKAKYDPGSRAPHLYAKSVHHA
jgi:FAD/FMN-containing dehydrogenase